MDVNENLSELHMDPFLVWTSKNDFLEEYKKLDERCMAQVYFEVLRELVKAVCNGSRMDKFTSLSDAAGWIVGVTSTETLNRYHKDERNPLKKTNMLILACQLCRIDTLCWLFSCGLKNLNGDVLSPNAEDQEGHNVFYYAVRSSNVELLQTLTDKWPANHFTMQPETLDVFLSAAYEELKLKNVALSNEMHFFLHNKLVNLRFYVNKQGPVSICDIEDRIDLLLENNASLQAKYAAFAEVDEKFLYIASFIARNIRVLKGQLKFTYDQLPWEEMEFCLVIFVTSRSKVQELNSFYRSTISITNILKYLDDFSSILGTLKGNISQMRTSRLVRDNAIASIIRTHPSFQGLYDDYQEVRDVYSLNVMSGYIAQALAADCKMRIGQLVIKRALQVIGEHLKNSLDSPNLSNPLSEMLILSAPKETKKVLTDLRNSLSHIHSFDDYHDDHKLYSNVQVDLKKISAVISDISLLKKIQKFKSTLKTIIDTKSSEEIHQNMQLLFHDAGSLNSETFTDPTTHDEKQVQKLIDEIDALVPEKTHHEKEIIDAIYKLFCKKRESLKNSHENYFFGLGNLTSIYHFGLSEDSRSTLSHDSLVRYTKREAVRLLKNFPQHSEYESPEEPINLLISFYNSVSARISHQTAADIKLSINKINYLTFYTPRNIQWIDEYGDHLVKYKKKKSLNNSLTDDQIKNQMENDMDQLKDILNCNNITNNANPTNVFNCHRLAIEVLVLDIMSILDNSKGLASNPLYLDDKVALLTGKCLRNQLAHGNVLVDMLFPDHFYALLANAKILTEYNSQNNQTSIDLHHSMRKLKQKYHYEIDVIDKLEVMRTALIDGNLENLKESLMMGADVHSRSVNLHSTLHYAAQGPSLDAVKYLINMNAKADSTDIYGQTPLHIAALYGRVNIVEYLVKEIELQISAVDNNGRSPLHLAAQNGHEETVKILLSLGASCTMRDRRGFTSLHYAVMNNRIRAVKVLLEQDENVDANKSNVGCTVLFLASEVGHVNLVRYFLSKNADADAKGYTNSRPLLAAAQNGHLEVVKILIEKGAHVNLTSRNGLTALWTAVYSAHEEIVNILLENRAFVNVSDETHNCTPLHLAACNGHRGLVELLIKYKADVNAADYQGATPLIQAAINGHSIVAKLLLENGALVDKTINLGFTALHLGAMHGGRDIIQCLLERGLQINTRAEHQETPLQLAAYKGNLETVCALLDEEADVNSVDDYGNTPLLFSVYRGGHIDISEALIKKRANVNHTNSHCMSALHLIATVPDEEKTIQLLLKHEINVNQQDEDGNTALHLASTWGNSASAHVLITGKAGLNVVTNAGDTPLHKATSSNHKTIAEMLLAEGANVNIVNKDGCSALSIAARSNNKELVNMLIANGADVNSEGNRPLHSAVFAGHKRIVDILLKHKDIDLNVEDKEGLTLLHLAAVHGHWNIGRALIERGVNADVKNSNQVTPLSIAVFKDKKEFLDMLIAKRANVNLIYPENTSLLQIAIERGNPDIVRSLLSAGAVLDNQAEENKPETLFELGVVLANLEVIDVLFNHQCVDVNYIGSESRTALHTAAQLGKLDVLKYLIAKGADIDVKNTLGSKAIHIAALNGHKKIIDFFLEHGMCIGDLGTVGGQLLHYAAAGDQEAVVHYLLGKGADVNAVDDFGDTPLHLSVRSGYVHIVKILLNCGSMYNTTNKCGLKPLDYAKTKDMSNLFISIRNLFKAVKDNAITKVEELIHSVESSVNAKCANNGTLLHLVAWKGFGELCEVLLKSKAEPNALGKGGNTALHYAAKFSHWRIVQSLLAAGAIYNVKAGTGKTSLDLASHNKVKYLLLLVQESFRKVLNCDVQVLDDLNKTHDTNILKAVFKARNENNQTLLVVAINCHFPQVVKLKDIVVKDLSNTMFMVNEIAFLQENFTGALHILNTMLNNIREVIGEDNPITLELQQKIATVFCAQKNYSQALVLHEEVYQKQCLVFGKNSESSLIAKRYTACVLSEQGKNKEAYYITQEVYEEQNKILAEDHIDILGTRRQIAILLYYLQRIEEALIMLKEVTEISIRVFGPVHQFTIHIQELLAVLNCKGNQEEAFRLFREMYKVEMATLGPNHSKTLRTRHDMAIVLVNQNKRDEALKEFQQVLAIQKNFLGPCHRDTLHTERNMVALYCSTNQPINAVQVLNSIGFDRRKEILGPHHPDVLELDQIRQDISRFSGFSFIPFDIPTKTQPALITAVENGDKTEVERLFTNGCNLDEEDGAKRTALHFAASKGLVDILRFLLFNGADATITTLKGNTTLHTAASLGYCSIVELLLQNVRETKKILFNDFINAKTCVVESTALHVAARRGYKQIVTVLLTYGACHDVVDRALQQTPLQSSHQQDIISLLEAVQKLFESARRGDVEVIAKISAMDGKERLAVLNARNNQLLTGREVALLNRHNNMATFLARLAEDGSIY